MGDPGLLQKPPAILALWPDGGGDRKQGTEADGATTRLVAPAVAQPNHVAQPIPVARPIPDPELNHRLARGSYYCS
jgi:hypothetical protein